MKYCIPYYRDFKYFDNADEIVLTYKGVHNGTNIVKWVTDHYAQEQRIIVDIIEREIDIEDMIPILAMLKQKHENMVVKTSISDYELLRKEDIPYFFAEFCNTIDKVYSFISRGVTDVYIVESLCFDLKEIGEFCHEQGVKVRVFPNIAQYSVGEKEHIPDPCKFFIRPEDTDFYEEYVDVFEFMGGNRELSTLFEIYKNKQWLGDLKLIIAGLTNDFPNTGILPLFGTQRTKCQHRCMIGKCSLCMNICNVSGELFEEGIVIKRDREKGWKENGYKPKMDEESNESEYKESLEGADSVFEGERIQED